MLRRTLLAVAGLAVSPLTAAGAPTLVFDGARAVTRGAPYSVDVDGDGALDLRFQYDAWDFHTMISWDATVSRASTASAALLRAFGGDFVTVLYKFDSGQRIMVDQSNGASSAYACVEDYPVWEGEWLDGQPGFMGFSFDIAGQRHHGWAEFRVQPTGNPLNGSMTVTRIAYETEPGVPIDAGVGQPGTGCNPADTSPPFNVLDLADVAAFADAFMALDPAADLNGDGLHDLGDVIGFIDAFMAGCP